MMLVSRGTPSRSYGMACSHLDLPPGAAGGMSCVLEPGGRSVFHRHHEREIFVIVKGRGRLSVDGQDMGEFGAGDSIYLRSFAGHALLNLSATEAMEFVALYWEEKEVERPVAPLPGRVLIFSTPPTPNGDLHLGHLSGPYLGADVYRRYLRQKGVPALHITGRDDNQTYVKRIATAERIAPALAADAYAAKIRATWDRAGIPLDYFSSPAETPQYTERLAAVIQRLHDRGYIVARKVEELYDVETGASLHEGYITGGCPHCGAGSDGNACEQCGRPNDCTDLRDPVPTSAGVVVGRRQAEKLYFRMSALAPQLADLVARSNMSTRARALSLGMLADGLPDICISHRSDWGMPFPLQGFQDQIVYVWFEMAAGYLAADRHASAARPFFEDRASSIVHFYGFDNTYYHTLLLPAVYYALGEDVNVPVDHVINELLFLRGEKFSTSRRHLIWGRKLLEHVPADYVRWGLCRVRPELKNENFDLDRFIADTNAFFADRLQAWLDDSLAQLEVRFERVVPEPGAWSHQHIAFQEQVRHLSVAAENAYQVTSFSPQLATRRLEELVAAAAEFLATQSRHESHPVMHDHQRTTFALNFWAMALFARLAMSIVPDTAQPMLDLLGLEKQTQIDGTGAFITHGLALDPATAPRFAPVPTTIREAVSCVT
jgi:methionyl-tRNA synthetase